MKLTLVQTWFAITISLFIILAAAYLLLHTYIGGAEVIRLSKQEINDINLIMFGNNDTTAAVPGPSGPTDASRKESVFKYIFSVRKPYSRADSATLVSQFQSYTPQQFSAVLSNYPIKVKSYFWLTDKMVYLEILFWSIFGLIASLLYNVSESLRTGEFMPAEISVHVAKLFYAPLCAVVIYLSINALTSSGDLALTEFSNSTIVLSFILGFFSGRTIELLNKVKDLLLPAAGSPQASTTSQEGSFSISGTIKGADFQASLSSVTITLFSLADVQFTRIENAGEDGSFLFENLKEGEYLLRAQLNHPAGIYTGETHAKTGAENPAPAVEIILHQYPDTTSSSDDEDSRQPL